MITAVVVWWHDRVLRHTIQERRVSVPMFDIHAKGILYRCVTPGCGKVWAR
jgi:hypothetical protein